MPPKKSKVEDQSPVTPTKPKPKPKAEAKAEAKAPETPTKTPVKTPVKTPAKTPSRKKAERVVEWKELPQADSGSSEPRPLQIKILVDGSFQASPINDKESSYFGQVIKLKAPSSFTAISTTMITEGPNEGYQAILIRPARPFDFMKLTPEIRNRIYSYYFASVGVVDNPIVVDGKRSTQSKQPYAKTYCKGDTNRVALLAVSKEVNKESLQIFSALPIQVDSTTSLMEFITEIEPETRAQITNIRIKSFQKTSAKLALHILSECKNLTRLHFATGVNAEADVEKAVKAFYEVSYKFLQAIAASKGGDKDAAVEVLSFGKMALTSKEKDKVEAWPREKVAEFKEALKAKLK